MRITVYEILEYLAGGMAESEILGNSLELTAEDFIACLVFVVDHMKKLFVTSL